MMSFWHALRQQLDGQDTLASLIVNLFWSAVTIVIIVLATRLVKRVARRVLLRARVPVNVVALAGNGITVTAVALGAAILLALFGVPPTAVVTAFSLATAGIVLAFQDVLKNFIAGIYLLVERPFTIGDRVKVRDAEGAVEAVDIRTTSLKTDAGVIVLVPNNIIFTEIVQNRSRLGIGHVVLTLTNVKGAPDAVSAQAREAILRIDNIATLPAPHTQIVGVQDGTAEVQVEFWYRGTASPAPQAIALLGDQFPGARITSAS